MRASATAAICCAALALSSDGLQAQQDPTTIGAGQRPYVMLIVDTSASMAFSQEGESRYPCHSKDGNDALRDTCEKTRGETPRGEPTKTIHEWRPNEYLTRSKDADDLKNDDSELKTYVGPCVTWVPKCEQYSRPGWLPEASSDFFQGQGNTKNYYDDYTTDDEDEMRGEYTPTDPPATAFEEPHAGRLSNFNQPRHVQIKELLTGDMILRPEITAGVIDDSALDPEQFGPGCFFVPRMHGVRTGPDSYSICHDEQRINPGDDTDRRTILVPSPANTDFPKFVDYNEPRPHIQEVYDFQRRNGLLDNLSNVAIFSVAMFDGFQGREPVETGSGWQFGKTFRDGSAGDTPGGADAESGTTYNLGLFRVVGPSVPLHDIETTDLTSLSAFAQLAVKDAGYLSLDASPDFVEDGSGSSFLDLSFPAGFDLLVAPFRLGRQPIARGTPLAAAIYDVHMFFRHGQHEQQVQPGNDDQPNTSSPVSNPVFEDDFYECRGKHVVMLTDGYPEPEAPGGPGGDIGSERLTGAYSYDEPDAYPYAPAEVEIDAFVNYANNTAKSVITNPKFQTRVHIVGLNTERGVAGPDADDSAVRRKMGAMAASGKTCALYYLSQSPEGLAFIPNDLTLDWIGGTPGTCDVGAGDNCLVVQFDAASAPTIDVGRDEDNDGSSIGEEIKCQAPALILSSNDQRFNGTLEAGDNRQFRDDLAFALQIVFNEVIDVTGGVASRTRTAVTNAIAQAGDRGQYRVFSGTEVGAASVYWKGLLNRQPFVCGNGNPPVPNPLCSAADFASPDAPKKCVWPMHLDVAAQVRKNGTSWQDNRRLFTSIPDLGSNQGSGNPVIQQTGNPVFPVSYDLRPISNSGGTNVTEDTFSETTLLNPANAEFVEGTRVPIRAPQLLELATSLGATNELNFLFGVSNNLQFERVINSTRGWLDEKEGQALNAILNSNPTIVGPPALDLPISSYRDFRDRYRSRATMLYVSTLDGILHAIHAGEQNKQGTEDRNILVRGFSGMNNKANETTGAVIDDYATPRNSQNIQREAWGYLPNLVRLELHPNIDRQPNLLDGSPVIKDVRLCDANPDRNYSKQACGAVSDASSSSIPGSMQWRTVLVQGLGQAGSGYFALDVTRSGGPVVDEGSTDGVAIEDPDPIVLWEFDGDWEQRQLELIDPPRRGAMTSLNSLVTSLLAGCPGTGLTNSLGLPTGNCDADGLSKQPFMGLSTGDPAIGTVVLKEDDTPTAAQFQRPIAMFGAGRVSPDIKTGADFGRTNRMGRAVYVVDLQTGSLLRRFTSYNDENGDTRGFEYEMSGTPALFNDSVGSVTNRGFIGDAGGRLFRIDMSSADPALWSAQLMYDPCKSSNLKAEANQIHTNAGKTGEGCPVPSTNADYVNPPQRAVGPAEFPPAVALDESRRLVVTYGLGDKTDTTSGASLQAVIAIAEQFELSGTDLVFKPVPNAERFAIPFEDGEKLTGAPTIFGGGVYFTTYFTDPLNKCDPGTSRIYGLDFNEQVFGDGAAGTVVGKFQGGAGTQFEDPSILKSSADALGRYIWVGPEEPTLIRGLTIAFDVDCSGDPNGPAGSFSETGDPPQPTLIAQIGGTEPPANIGQGNPGQSSDGIARVEIKLDRLKSQAIPLSWAVIGY